MRIEFYRCQISAITNMELELTHKTTSSIRQAWSHMYPRISTCIQIHTYNIHGIRPVKLVLTPSYSFFSFWKCLSRYVGFITLSTSPLPALSRSPGSWKITIFVHHFFEKEGKEAGKVGRQAIKQPKKIEWFNLWRS